MAMDTGAHPSSETTASGYLALLGEPDATLQVHALKKLLGCVDTLWHEVAESLPDLEALAEDAGFQGREMAAAVASRVFFHLGEPTQALRLALEAGPTHFDLRQSATSPYVARLVAAALDVYIAQQQKQQDGEAPSAAEGDDEAAALPMDQLQALVYRMMETSCQEGNYEHALGIALEARLTEKVQDILKAGAASPALLQYTLRSAVQVVSAKAFRTQVLKVVAQALSEQLTTSKKAAVDLILVHQLLKDPAPVSEVLTTLLQGDQDSTLLAYQLCFDLMDSGDQAFAKEVAMGLESNFKDKEPPQLAQALRVLMGGFSSELALSFLHKHSHADRLSMEQLKKTMEERGSGGRNSILHGAAVVTHAYLYAGTTNDSFLRDHLDWMKKASNWAKFSATASLGVVHAGHITEAMNLLQPYLPSAPDAPGASAVTASGGYAEGGSLYALGIIHGSHAGSSAEKRQETATLLRTHLRASHANEVISHGAALGVGLTNMGTASLEIVNELKELLYTDSAVAGEAAGLAIGMVLVGTGAGNATHSLRSDAMALQEVLAELKSYARETQHEKIIRGIAMGLALIQYGQEENADALIEEMRSDRDPILRYGAQYALALAYCGTGSNKAIKVLLHTAVSDVSDDVRMAAVLGVAFVLYKTPERVPQLVKLLLESFNPHVRYASCMAVGIAMAGTGDAKSIALLEPMMDDMTDYVRQGALMGTAMIYMQQSDMSNNKKIRSFREKLGSIVGDKHQSILTRMGAILSKGILDAGGRNCCLVLGSPRNGFTKMTSVVGLTLWLQHWHWYPLLHMFPLMLTPTYSIGLQKDFKFPKKGFELVCHSKPSAFAYPKKLEEKKEEKKKRVETVTLSTTAKNKARLARKKAKQEAAGGGASAMDIDESEKTTGTAGVEDDKKDDADTSMEVDESAAAVEKPKKKEPEPTEFQLANPSRMTLAQSQFCAFDLGQRYRPILPEGKPNVGVTILTDSKAATAADDDDDHLGAVKPPSMEPEGELAPPEPFEWAPPPPAAAPAAESTQEKKEDGDAEMKQD